MDRCPTGIIGFDRMCKGGFIRNSVNLIVGGPGSGKSTFLLEFLWEGATKFGENGIYCSFEPDILDTLNDAMAEGWDFTRLSSEGRIKFMKFSPQTSLSELKKELADTISKNNIKRICFDPISILAMNLNDKGKMREVIFELSSLMKRLKVTSVLADESLEGDGMTQTMVGEWTQTDILRFLTDSVTVFYETGIAGKTDRAVRITKMRRTNHERKPVPMKITNKGIEIEYEPPKKDQDKKAPDKKEEDKKVQENNIAQEKEKPNEREIQEKQEAQKQELLKRQQEIQRQQLLKKQEELRRQQEIKRQQDIQRQQLLQRQKELERQKGIQRQREQQNSQRPPQQKNNQPTSQTTQNNPQEHTAESLIDAA